MANMEFEAEHFLYVSEDFYTALEIMRTSVFKMEQHFCQRLNASPFTCSTL